MIMEVNLPDDIDNQRNNPESPYSERFSDEEDEREETERE
jgi:hypothetical protein